MKDMKHITVVYNSKMMKDLNANGCGECQSSCQSACKTSCTVGNQVCESNK
jgi:predicted ribosomally synthesized six-cysteine peptide SCIFF